MPHPPPPYAPTEADVLEIQRRLVFGVPWDWTHPGWTTRAAGGPPPDLGPMNPAAWGPWASESCEVLYAAPGAPQGAIRVATLSRRMDGHPNDPDGLCGPSWGYHLELDPERFPPPCPAHYCATREFLLEALAYLIASRTLSSPLQ